MTNSEIHSGYEFEEGMFSRMRTWVDVAPWIRLFRVMRILASPTHVGLVAIALVINQVLFGSWPWSAFQAYTVFDLETLGISPLQSAIAEQGLWALMYAVVSLLIWTPVFQFVARAGASLTAQQQLSACARDRRNRGLALVEILLGSPRSTLLHLGILAVAILGASTELCPTVSVGVDPDGLGDRNRLDSTGYSRIRSPVRCSAGNRRNGLRTRPGPDRLDQPRLRVSVSSTTAITLVFVGIRVVDHDRIATLGRSRGGIIGRRGRDFIAVSVGHHSNRGIAIGDRDRAD